jgi:hypothetical protein
VVICVAEWALDVAMLTDTACKCGQKEHEIEAKLCTVCREVEVTALDAVCECGQSANARSKQHYTLHAGKKYC